MDMKMCSMEENKIAAKITLSIIQYGCQIRKKLDKLYCFSKTNDI